jgi:ParB-like chromosome segregation protein Spo0J
MKTEVKMAFEKETLRVPISKILPTRTLPTSAKVGAKLKTIEASYPVVGIIEPPMVCRQRDGNYLLLDGHNRLALLMESGVKEVECIVATDDEAYTYNAHVSHLAPIQANRMILKALDDGVPEDKLARALARSITTIRMSRTMLRDICPEAIDLLKDKPVAAAALTLFKHVKPLRQIEMAELMNRMGNYTKPYAAGLVSRTRPELLAEPPKPKKSTRPKPEGLAQMELEMQSLEKDILQINESYGRDVVNLTIARSYVKKLLENAKIVKYLAGKHGDVLTEFQRIQDAASLDG